MIFCTPLVLAQYNKKLRRRNFGVSLELLSCCGARHLRRRKTPSSSADRCHSLPSLSPPPAAVGSLPKFELATRFHKIFDFVETLRPHV